LHRRPEFVEQKPDPSIIKPTVGPSSIDRNDNQNHHHATTSNDQPTKLVPQQPPGPNAAVNNRSIQPNATTNTVLKGKNTPQHNSSRPTPNAGNAATNVYKPPPPKNQPTNAPPTAPKQEAQQPAAKPETTDLATTSMDVDYMAGEDDMTFFESEDEKWMMGDFDIDLDVDLGRPIDFEADESVANQDDSGFLDADSSGNADTRKGTPSRVSGPAASASAQRNGTVSVSGHNNNKANNSGLGSSTNGNSNSAQRSGGSNPVGSTSTGVNPNGDGKNGNGNKEVRFQPLPNVHPGGNGTSNGNGNNRGQLQNGSNGNGSNGNGGGGRTNLSNSTSTVQPSGSGNGRPSAGGFSFPPSVVRCAFDLSICDHNHSH